MKRSLKTQLAAGNSLRSRLPVVCVPPVQSSRAQSVAIHVYDLASVSPTDLAEATEEAGRILATAGVQPVWQSGLPMRFGGS